MTRTLPGKMFVCVMLCIVAIGTVVWLVWGGPSLKPVPGATLAVLKETNVAGRPNLLVRFSPAARGAPSFPFGHKGFYSVYLDLTCELKDGTVTNLAWHDRGEYPNRAGDYLVALPHSVRSVQITRAEGQLGSWQDMRVPLVEFAGKPQKFRYRFDTNVFAVW